MPALATGPGAAAAAMLLVLAACGRPSVANNEAAAAPGHDRNPPVAPSQSTGAIGAAPAPEAPAPDTAGGPK